MQWWAWVAVGAILLGSELAFVDAQFYLVFLGGAAIIVGLLSLAGALPVVWLQWLLFAVVATLSMFAFRRRIYGRLRRNLPIMNHGPAGEIVVLPQTLAPGHTCRVEFRGSSWSAINGGHISISAGAHALIERVDGLTLVVREVRDS
jgi:membrane protein implicated in regulation of membrane protease activity